ncbi:enterobactin ABC transporter permease [Azorhizobium oxalatiphilum]|uniref:Enterobactin ABC transporter permease n=1 Tax=Azorhizobium oxalatiphilum TaxID=980631 RepID=A0A917BRA1_9HYPH|nr:iron chelate uptake ABC transporter family permease subunit [Azorhizobium oxalatiphilum]GGF54569.1 enterobactin ABC transporter permease [Azorhizobium oxalatiphilum]
MSPDFERRRARLVLALLAVAAAIAVLAFMTLGARGSWSFVLSFRGAKLAVLVLVAYAIAVSTVLFQTITGNRVLTPSLMGFDQLYMLLQTALVFLWGARGLTLLDPRALFALNVGVMVAFSLLLYRLLFARAGNSLHLLMLAGIVLGLLFRSLTTLLQRLINPNDFAVVQDRMFANFNGADGQLTLTCAALVLVVTLGLWRLSSTFDVLALGRDPAISLGVNHHRTVTLILMLVVALVAACTALVGPITFFGLLVANLAYLVMPSGKHRHTLPAAVLIAILFLVGGQTVLERVFAFNTALALVIEFLGGLAFILIVLKGRVR